MDSAIASIETTLSQATSDAYSLATAGGGGGITESHLNSTALSLATMVDSAISDVVATNTSTNLSLGTQLLSDIASVATALDSAISDVDAELDAVSDSASAHKANNGSDHSYVDQDVKVAATPQFASLGLGVAANSTSTLNIIEDAKSTTATWYPIFNRSAKTAGVTDVDDVYYGLYNRATYNQSGGVIGHFRGLYNNLQHLDGDIGSGAVSKAAYCLFNALTLTGGKVYGDVRSDFISVNQGSSHEVTGDFDGVHLYMTSNGTVGGVVRMLYLNEGAGIDFGIYQDGSAMNYFGGPVSIPNMKAGTTQAAAGAAAGELWSDTDDGGTVKLGA